MSPPAARAGVVGHVEWVECAVVEHPPRPGEIVQARETFLAAAGSGAVAAVQMRRIDGASAFFTALGGDEAGRRAGDELRERHGVDVHAASREAPQRRGFVHLDDDHERTITVVGERLVPERADDLPWERLGELEAVYFTGGDVGALRAARAARVLVATPRALPTLRAAGVELDVLVASANDPAEAVADGELVPAPRHVVLTHGAEGGEWTAAQGGGSGRWVAAELPGPPVDSYGSGDSFAGGLTLALGAGRRLGEALEFAARCGAACLTGRGPYGAAMPRLD